MPPPIAMPKQINPVDPTANIDADRAAKILAAKQAAQVSNFNPADPYIDPNTNYIPPTATGENPYHTDLNPVDNTPVNNYPTLPPANNPFDVAPDPAPPDYTGWDNGVMSQIDSLYQALGLTGANLDYQSQEYGMNFNNQQRLINNGMTEGLRGNSTRNADRGLSQSGIALQLDTDTRNRADQQLGKATQGFDSNLQAVARKRLQAEAEYNLNKLNLEKNLKGAVKNYTPPPAPTNNGLPYAN